MKYKKLCFGVVLFAALAFFPASLLSQSNSFTYRQDYITGLASPVLLTNARDGSGRLFIVEQAGKIKVVQRGSSSPTEFLNISARVICCGERGLLGLTFHPNFATNHYFFVHYTRQTDGATVISRFTAIENNSKGDPNSERVILGPVAQPFTTHKGGSIDFREDLPGVFNLYIGLGDGGSANDPGARAQNMDLLLGKFLRITPDVSGNDANPAYTIPADNPYVGVDGADEIFAVGFRNPWRWSFDRGGTHQLWVGDVGQNAVEEIDIVTRGANYGWRVYEGAECSGLDPELCNPTNFTMPLISYDSDSPRCAITGGYVYRGRRRALPLGTYVFADYCSGEIFKWENNQQVVLLDTSRFIVSFGEDEDGELYVVYQTSGAGGIDRILGAEKRPASDFDGDKKTDQALFRPSDNTWYTLLSSNFHFAITRFGLTGDLPAAEDFDGDGKTDIAVYRPSDGTWYMITSSNFAYTYERFGLEGDTPKPGDFDGDGKADLVVFRNSNGKWFVRRSRDRGQISVDWGLPGDIPVSSDFDGDFRVDYAVWRPSNDTWYAVSSINGSFLTVRWGLPNDVPSPGDYDGDGKSDLMVWRPSTGEWHLRKSSNNHIVVQGWGLNGDIPVASDWDGDTVDDIAVFRPSDGRWYIIGSSTGIRVTPQWGLSGDQPIPKYDTP